MNCYNCENEIRDKENQKICYDDCISYQKMKKRNKVIQINRRKDGFGTAVNTESYERAARRKAGKR